ncbi:hypothetical protein B9Z19DRAFT_1090020 [Tuber borchii]|uniref:Uncharacterized protein n=1 Tax=Tuber borchii TaxID=42251 RepID=A0A2T6ZJB2_TUBBO|nr:hypothetical protein B9Z19DRAFT_1090020 [Tuber borchii]
MAALEVVGTGIENDGIENDGIENDGIENDGIENDGTENDGIGNDVGVGMGYVIREHSSFGPQAKPCSQHPLPQRIYINGHGFEQSFPPGMHSYPSSQHHGPFGHIKCLGSHSGGPWHLVGPPSSKQVDPIGQHHPAFWQR